MKYVVAAIICTMAGVGILQLYADIPGICGYTYKNDPGGPAPEPLDSVYVYARSASTQEIYHGNTKDSFSHNFYKADKNGSTSGEHYHFYIPQNDYYHIWGHKDVEGGYWESQVYESIPYFDSSTQQDIILDFYEDK